MSAAPSSCRILTIASSLPEAKQIIDNIIAAQDGPDQPDTPTAPSSSGVNLFPWLISNKYYTALVHFSISRTSEVTISDAIEVPACLFVFDATREFKNEFTSIISRLKNADFEVSIAVSALSESAETSSEEHNALEEFFSTYGFEYVKGQAISIPSKRNHMDDLDGIQGIHRIIDALSTIMWPSMIQRTSSRRAKARSVVSVPAPDEDDVEGLRALLDADENKDVSQGTTAFERAMSEFENWLEEDNGTWSRASSNVASSQPNSGFDDNFSDFVSAPSYANPDDDDLDLPSQAEIVSMSHQIRDLGAVPPADESDFNAFDLSSVLAGLEAMKTEIASLENEDERRRAAARVALGLVYGLGDNEKDG